MSGDRVLHDRLAADYHRKYEESRASRLFIEYEVGFIRAGLPEACSLLIEVGCGAGSARELLAGGCNTYVGVDYSKEMTKEAAKRGGLFVCGDATALPFKQEVADAVVFRGALHHIREPEKALMETSRISRGEGRVLFVEPNNVDPVINLIRWLMKKFFASYSEDQQSFNERQIRNMLTRAGFAVQGVQHLGYVSNPFEYTDKMPASKFIPEAVFRLVLAVDDIIAKIPVINRLSWGLYAAAEKPPTSQPSFSRA